MTKTASDAGQQHYETARALLQAGRAEQALVELQAASRLCPGSFEIQASLGASLAAIGRFQDAATAYQAAAIAQPDRPEIHFSLANALGCAGNISAAIAVFRVCLTLQPNLMEARFNLGRLLMGSGQFAEAEDCFRAVLKDRPGIATVHAHLGVVLELQNRLPDAAHSYQTALQLTPGDAEIHFNLARIAGFQNDTHKAMAYLERCILLNENHGTAQFAYPASVLPILYSDAAEIDQCRAHYEKNLRALVEKAATNKNPAFLRGAGTSPPFLLAYAGRNDRALQAVYGQLVARLLAQLHPAAPMPTPPEPGEKIRIGFVSSFFCNHTVWELMLRGWLTHWDRTQFDIFAYHTGIKQDRQTQVAQALSPQFKTGLGSGEAWRNAILADRPHVLIYPEIGMDPMTSQLAAQRLAPIQCVGWGHPVTTGLPTIDYFLSSAAMETNKNTEEYTEQLVCLPNLGIFYEPPEISSSTLTRAQLGLRQDAVIYWSGQSVYKYLPQYDSVFPAIAKAVGDCQFVFLSYKAGGTADELFQHRLARAFAAQGLRAEDHCVLLPNLPRHDFIGAIGLCDVVLDTIGWSGGRSTLEALTSNPPIVTLPGTLMRSRHSAAMLLLMDLPELVAANVKNYVDIASRLGNDPAWRERLRGTIAQNKQRLFRDFKAIETLQEFLKTCALKR